MKAAKTAAVAACAATLVAASWAAWETHGLPGRDRIRDQVLTRTGSHPGTWVPLWAVSAPLQAAVVLWEDPAFYHHRGLDYPEIARAAWADLRAGGYFRGASTITQQVARNLFLTPEKSLRRKLREAILAWRMERALSKDEILTLYLNIAEWGEGTYGVEDASRRYFGKSASELGWAEAALLAGILPNPRQWNPCRDPARAVQARRAVLAKLLSVQALSLQEVEGAERARLASCGPRTLPSDFRAGSEATRTAYLKPRAASVPLGQLEDPRHHPPQGSPGTSGTLTVF